MELLHKEITEKLIKAYYKVYNTPGHGFLEKVYENAMAIELRNYLKATEVELGLLMNFGKIAEYKRKIFMNKFKLVNALLYYFRIVLKWANILFEEHKIHIQGV